MTPPCLLLIASFRKLSASNRVVCDEPIHQFLQNWCWWPCPGAPPQKSPDEKSHLVFISIKYRHPLPLSSCTSFPSPGQCWPCTSTWWDVRGDAAPLGTLCHSELHSLGSNPVAWSVIRQQCQSVINVSRWWIYYNNITIGSPRNVLYLNLSFSMVTYCVPSSYFSLLVLSDADNGGGGKADVDNEFG